MFVQSCRGFNDVTPYREGTLGNLRSKPKFIASRRYCGPGSLALSMDDKYCSEFEVFGVIDFRIYINEEVTYLLYFEHYMRRIEALHGRTVFTIRVFMLAIIV